MVEMQILRGRGLLHVLRNIKWEKALQSFQSPSKVRHRFERKHASIAIYGRVACTENVIHFTKTHTYTHKSPASKPLWMCLPRLRQNDFLARPGRWSRFALLHRHQVTDISEHRFKVRHLSTLGRPNRLNNRAGKGGFWFRGLKTTSSARCDPHQGPRRAVGAGWMDDGADRLLGNGGVVCSSKSVQTTIVVT